MNLGYTGNGQFGYDTVSLGHPNSGGPSLSKQVVAGLATPDFWLGEVSARLHIFGRNILISMRSKMSYLWTLRYQSMIPRYNKIQGSLTLGGYDTSQFDSKNVTFPFYNDVSRRFLTDLRSITYIPTGVSTITTSTTLMSQSISMYIDSTIPYIYLPLDACAKFESAFGLVWNATDEIYTLNDTAHATLKSTNPSITFTIANTGGETLDIVLPYSAFDLTASFPVLSNGTNSTAYFLLKRATNDTQYTLGRVFLQEAYLIADYDRSEFTVAPCVWPSTFTKNIVAIHPPGSNNTITVVPKSKTAESRIPADGSYQGQTELSTGVESVQNEMSAYEKAQKQQRLSEIAGTPLIGQEMDAQAGVGNELESRQVYEMPAKPVGSELHAPHRPVR
ncbi:hypothetical protein IFR05_007824 [Cadophora sp. M221]|nr:hypothetical protein IFR05_007824 [Cadophora sp. M221]